MHPAAIGASVKDVGNGMLEMSVYVFEGEAAGDHQHLGVVEELRQLFRGAVAALMLGGHPRLGRLLDELLADRVRTRLEELGRA